MIIVDQISEIWSQSIRIAEFGHAVTMGFEVNLAYSLVLKLGEFSGRALRTWASTDKLRVKAAVAEFTWFNLPRFLNRLDDEVRFHRELIARINTFIITWAVIAGTSCALGAICTPLLPRYTTKGCYAIFYFLFVFAPVPAGFLANVSIRLLAINRMKKLSANVDEMLRYVSQQADDKIRKALGSLDELRQTRRGSDGDPGA